MPPTPSNDLIAALARHGVPFVVVGGHAVNFHGHIRLTEDTDVLWMRSRESEVALLAALQEVNACWISNERIRTQGWSGRSPLPRDTSASPG
jgi:hypothetical protein